VLVENSTYSRGRLKERLYETGLKMRLCELCGQGELWQGRWMALILDHVNGGARDNRIENLRIVCPNCAATLDTHCGRRARLEREERRCRRCGATFRPRVARQAYCSGYCGQRWERKGRQVPAARKVRERPPYAQLIAEVAATSWSAVGRKYGVTDNAIRKWVRAYERERAARAA
jgi:transposase-like protein